MKFKSLTDRSIGQFFYDQGSWTLTSLIIGTLAAGLINWKNKFGIAFLIGGLIILFVGLSVLWKTIKLNNRTLQERKKSNF